MQPKGKASGRKSEETRERILAAALELFREEGYSAGSMRQVASRAGLSPGAAYYYFQSKDEIVLEFYRRTQAEARAELGRICLETRSFPERLRRAVEARLAQFEPHRRFVKVLYQNAVDPDSPLSPFHPDMQALRRESVEDFAGLLRESDAKLLPELRPHAAYLFWLYSLAILLYWLFDGSPGQRRTRRLLEFTCGVIGQLIRLHRLPVARGLAKSAARVLDEFVPYEVQIRAE